MKPILFERGIGKGASAMDGKSGRDSCYLRLGKIFRSLDRWRLGYMGLSHVGRTMEKGRWSSQPSRATPAWVLTPAISLWNVFDGGPAGNEVNGVEFLRLFRSTAVNYVPRANLYSVLYFTDITS